MSDHTIGIQTRDLQLTKQMRWPLRYGVAFIHSGAKMASLQLACTSWQLTLLTFFFLGNPNWRKISKLSLFLGSGKVQMWRKTLIRCVCLYTLQKSRLQTHLTITVRKLECVSCAPNRRMAVKVKFYCFCIQVELVTHFPWHVSQRIVIH